MLGNTVSAAVASGFATARALAITYYEEYTEVYATELHYAKIGSLIIGASLTYATATVTAYCTGELLGLPRGWVGILISSTFSYPALALYATCGGGYAAAGYLLGFKKLHLMGRRMLYTVLPSYMSTSGPQETPIFAAIKGGKVWHEPLGGGPASGPETLPGLSGDTVGAFEYEGEVFLVGKDGSLNKPLLARDCLENSPVLFAMMDWTAQAVFVHNSRIFLVKEGKVWHDALAGGDLKGPETWGIIDDSVQGAYMYEGRFYVFKGGHVYHEKIGGGPIIGPEKWPIIDNLVMKNGELWHERLGGGDVHGPETKSYVDWAVQACWFHENRVFLVRGGNVEHFQFPPLPLATSAAAFKSLPEHPTRIRANAQAVWVHNHMLHEVVNGEVFAQQIGGGKSKGPEKWDIIDDTVQGAYVHEGRLFVVKGGKVFHQETENSRGKDGILGPETWPLVDETVQAALVTTDVHLGIAQFVTAVGMPIYALDEKSTSRLLADVILESSHSVDLAQQIAAASQAKHLTGAVLATYTILDLCQDFGLAAPVAKDVVGAVRKYSKTGVPQGVIR